jgi:hypothetical protein
VVFAHEAGSLQDNGERAFRNAVVNARTYNTATLVVPDPENEEGEEDTIEVEATYGQISPGVPWYALADPGLVTDTGNWTYHLLVGGVENEDYRYNLGVLNASDPLTVLTVAIQPLQPNGQPYLDENDSEIVNLVQLAPLAHLQYNRVLQNLEVDGDPPSAVKVSHVSWSSSGADPRPALTSYGSLIDNNSNDATTILPTFAFGFDVDCVFVGCEETSKTSGRLLPGRVTRRPLSMAPIGPSRN